MGKNPLSIHKIFSYSNLGKFRIDADTEGAAHPEKVKN